MYRRTGSRATLLCMIAGGSLVCALATDADGAPESNTLVLETLLKQHAAAYDAIESIEMEYSYRIEHDVESKYTPDGELAVSGGNEIEIGVIEYWNQEEFKRELLRFQREYPDRNAIMRDTREQISTPEFHAIYLESATHVTVYHLDKLGTLAPAVAALRESIPRLDLLDFGFTRQQGQLLRTYHDHQERSTGKYQYEWKLSGGNTEPYTIEVMVRSEGSSWKSREMIINQHCGFLRTRYSTYNEEGQLTYEALVKPHFVSGQIWVAGHAREWSDENRTVEITLEHVKINEMIPPERFTVADMAFDPEQTILSEHVHNQKGLPKAFYGGVWIPKAQWPDEVKRRVQRFPRHVPEHRGFSGIWVKGSPTE